MFNSNLSMMEKERISYINGDVLVASIFGEASEFEQEVDGYDDKILSTKNDAFEEGKIEGLGRNAAAEIYDLERKLKEADDRNKKLYQVLLDYTKIFYLEDMKTVAGRKRVLASVQNKIHFASPY